MKDKNYYEKVASQEEFLSWYKEQDLPNYEKPSLTSDAVIFALNEENKVCIVLIKRGANPFRGAYALPGGFVEPNESTTEAIIRELSEETGLEVFEEQVEQLATYSTPGRDPRTWVVTVAHLAFLRAPQLKQLQAGDDASSVILAEVDFKTESVKVDGQLAFDHEQIVLDAIRRVKGHTEWKPIFLEMLGEETCEFTLAQATDVINQVCEPGREILQQNFTKRFKRFVEDTGKQVRVERAKRPSTLYTLAKSLRK